jgi:hypothetical protein
VVNRRLGKSAARNPCTALLPCRLATYLTLGGDRPQQILQPDTPKHLRADTIGDAVDDFRPILGGIHMNAEWAPVTMATLLDSLLIGHQTS